MNAINDSLRLAPPSRAEITHGCNVPGSLTDRIRQFYIANPDEELSYVDMAIKFGCSRDSARNAVAELRKQGMLEALHIVRVRLQVTA